MQFLFIDHHVADGQTLAAQALNNNPDTRIVYLDADQSGIDQISDALAGASGVTGVHLISHGGNGYITLGTDVLSNDTLAFHADMIEGWGQSLAQGADILLYGCSVAGSPDGIAFAKALSALSGADVAASDDKTGVVSHNSDGELEVRIGAIETDSLSTADMTETLGTYQVTNNSSLESESGSLAWAIKQAENSGDATSTITFAASLTDAAGTGNADEILLTSQLKIRNNNDLQLDFSGHTGGISIDGGNSTRLFSIEGGSDVTISGDDKLTLENGYSENYAGLIFVRNVGAVNSLTIDKTILQNGRTANGGNKGDGGAIRIGEGTLTITDSSFLNNYAADDGGAIAVQGDTNLYLNYGTRNNVFQGNESKDEGGAIGMTSQGAGYKFIANKVTFQNNKAADNGGAIDIQGMSGTTSIAGSTFTGNYVVNSASANRGGALDLNGGTGDVYITGNTFTNNSVGGGAGSGSAGVLSFSQSEGGSLALSGNTLSGNVAADYPDTSMVLRTGGTSLTGTDKGDRIVLATSGTGAITLVGGDGNDTLIGDDGNDDIAGGTGTDEITSGNGNDTVRGSIDDLNGDTIFSFSDTDKIIVEGADESGLDGQSLNSGTLNFTSSGNTAKGIVFNGPTAGKLVATFDAGAGDTTIRLVKPTFDNARFFNGNADPAATSDFSPANVIQFTDGGTVDLNAREFSAGAVFSFSRNDGIDVSGGSGKSIASPSNVFLGTSFWLDWSSSANGYNVTGARSGGTGGHDRLEGGSGDDTINGETGNDFIIAGSGTNQITVDSSKDTGNDTVRGTADELNGDTITNFGYGDVLQLSGNSVSALNGQNLAANANLTLATGKSVTFSGNQTGTLKAVFSAGYTNISIAQPTFSVANSGDNSTAASNNTGSYDEAIQYDNASTPTNLTEIFLANGNTVDLTDQTTGINGAAITTPGDVSSRGFHLNWDHETIGLNVTGSSAADRLEAGGGNDTIAGGDGADSINGGAGNDTITIANATGTSFVKGGDGNDSMTSTGAGIANFSGGAGQDTLTGGSGGDSIQGGDDTDSVSGGAGVDYLSGNGGNDTLTGGDGNDFFYDSAANLAGDVITDFAIGDKIYVSGTDMSALDGQEAAGTISIGGGTLTLQGVTSAMGTFSVEISGSSSFISVVAPSPTPSPAPTPTPDTTPTPTPGITTPSVPDDEDIVNEVSLGNGPDENGDFSGSNSGGDFAKGTLPGSGGTGFALSGGVEISGNLTGMGTGGNSVLELLVPKVEEKAGDDTQSRQDMTQAAQNFLNNIGDTQDVEVLVLTFNGSQSGGVVRLNGGTTGPNKAFVIDTSGMSGGSDIVLNNIDFAAILGEVTVTGGTGNNVLSGDVRNQTIASGEGNDTIMAGGGNDTMDGGSGDDLLDGGDGTDVLSISGGFRDYNVGRVNQTSDGKKSVSVSGDDIGNDTLVDVEQVKFADGTLFFAGLTDEQIQVSRMYLTAFNRDGEIDGIQFWQSTVTQGQSVTDVANGFTNKDDIPEFAAMYGGAADNGEFVSLLYQIGLGRDADAEGFGYWTELLDQGLLTQGGVLLQIANSQEQIARLEAIYGDGVFLI